jgi:hypothetical protein
VFSFWIFQNSGVTPILLQQQLANGAINQFGGTGGPGKFGGTIAVSGNNVYAAWWNNKTGDFEVMPQQTVDTHLDQREISAILQALPQLMHR